MSKECQCKKNNIVENHCSGHCNCHDKRKAPGYYMAVCDVVETYCKIGDECYESDSYRYFNEKFVDSPEKALLFAFDNENLRWKVDPSEILKNVYYDPDTKEYIRKTVLTRDGHIPTDKQLEKILNGTYEYILLTEYVQVFETNLIASHNLVGSTVKRWREHTGIDY